MSRFLIAALCCLFFHLPAASAQICNDPSGFLKTFGAISLGDLLVLGPDCQHAADSQVQGASQPATIPPGARGYIQEATVPVGTPVNIPFHVSTAIITMNVGAGVWDCSGEDELQTSTPTISSEYHTAITTSQPPLIQTLPGSGGGNGNHNIYGNTATSVNTTVFNFGPRRFVFTVTTPVYLAAYSTFGTDAGGTNGSGTLGGYGYLRCELK